MKLMNNKRLFNEGWEFAKSSLKTVDSSALAFKTVDIPHDWLIYDTLNLYEDSIGWYRKTFTYIKNEKQVLLCFDGVYMDSSLYVNQQFIGEWKYGYSSFEHDITDALVDGENEMLMKVVYQSPNSRWYSGAGIYRNVWIKERDKNHIVSGGIYITTKQKDCIWKIEVSTEIEFSQDVQISHALFYKGKIITSSKNFITHNRSIVSQKSHSPYLQPNCSTHIDEQTLFIEDPLLWSTDEPNLYQLVTQLNIFSPNREIQIKSQGNLAPLHLASDNSLERDLKIESISQNIGFREIILDPQQGIKLNGRKMKLNGVCEHHDLGALGSAFNKTALKRRFAILKEMGVNAIRTAHNMPAPEFMDLADEMGMLVVSEAFDMWERSKTPYDYSRFFSDWAHIDVKSWIMRDRNHPSLLMWSIGNEIYDTHADDRGQELTEMLKGYVLKYDPKENAKVTIGSNYMPWENAQKCADIVKVAGYNYAEKYYHKHHEEHPDWIIYGSETCSVADRVQII